MSNIETLRTVARSLFDAGVAKADPAQAVQQSLSAEPVHADRVVAVGKAALPMVYAALETLPEKPPSLVVTNAENIAGRMFSDIRVLAAGHPVPDENGAAAAREVEFFVAGAGEGETVLVLVSGGASAMLPAPIEGVSLQDKIAVTRALLACGAPINEINTVRRALSRLKSGGLARAIHPARTVALLLSDVPHDDIAAIASGPTVLGDSRATNAKAAIEVLDRYGLHSDVPNCVAALLARMAEPTETMNDGIRVENRLVGGNGPSLDAMVTEAERRGLPHTIVSRWLDGDVSDAAQVLHRAATMASTGGIILLAGGETTVVLQGTGQGGRNQELALRFAMLCENEPLNRPWAFLSGGTDGRDGPTIAAGGLVNATTLARIQATGADPQALLGNNDSFAALDAAGDLLITGATGTNVADLQVLVLGERNNDQSERGAAT